MKDCIICHDKEDAKNLIDVIGRYVEEFEYLENGKIRLNLNCKVTEIVEELKEHKNADSK